MAAAMQQMPVRPMSRADSVVGSVMPPHLALASQVPSATVTYPVVELGPGAVAVPPEALVQVLQLQQPTLQFLVVRYLRLVGS